MTANSNEASVEMYTEPAFEVDKVAKVTRKNGTDSPSTSGDESRETQEPEVANRLMEDLDSLLATDGVSSPAHPPQDEFAMSASEASDENKATGDLTIAAEVARLQVALKEMAPLLKMQHESLTRSTQMIIERGWSNITWNRDYTGLHLAAELGERDAIPLLVALNADPNCVDYKNRTPADIARKHKRLHTLELLQTYEDEAAGEASPGGVKTAAAWLEKGLAKTQRSVKAAEVESMEAKKHRLETALVEASRFLDVEPRLQRLIEDAAKRGWKEETTDTTVLHCAAVLGSEDVLALLVTLVGNVDVQDNHGRTPMDVAIKGQQWSCVAKLRDLQRGEGQVAATGADAKTASEDADAAPEVQVERFIFRERERSQKMPHDRQWQSEVSDHEGRGLDYGAVPSPIAFPTSMLGEAFPTAPGLSRHWLNGTDLARGYAQDQVLPYGEYPHAMMPPIGHHSHPMSAGMHFDPVAAGSHFTGEMCDGMLPGLAARSFPRAPGFRHAPRV
mmetsp:Transcript_17383/g.40565  ORF Transcript_17383/g.40565 Transcript_17383/m.40565 type:complete len:505 (+) Transcript_17383:139-1653(+)